MVYLRLGARSVPPQNGCPLRHDHLDRLNVVRAPLAVASGTTAAQQQRCERDTVPGAGAGASRKMASKFVFAVL